MVDTPAGAKASRTAVPHVLWLIKELDRGGAERMTESGVPLINEGGRYDIEVAFVNSSADALVGPLRAHGVTVHDLHASSDADIRWLVRLRRILRVCDFRLLHTHSPYPAALARPTVPRRIPIVHTEHSGWDQYRPLTRVLNAATYARNAAVMAVSAATARTIRQPAWLPRSNYPPIEVIHQGIAEQPPASRNRHAARQSLGIADDALVVGMVGTLKQIKGQAFLIDAVAHLATRYPAIHLLLIGGGPDHDALRSLAAERGIASRVTLAGPRDDVSALLGAYDIFVLSSLQEGLPIALLEAMRAGLPSVATDVGGVREVVQEGEEGLLVRRADSAALTSAVAALLDDAQLRTGMGAKARLAATRFSITTTVERTQDVYDKVLDGEARPV